MTIEIELLAGDMLSGPTMMLMMILLWIVADKRRARRGTEGETEHVD